LLRNTWRVVCAGYFAQAVLFILAGCHGPSDAWKAAECIAGEPEKKCPAGYVCLDDYHCHQMCTKSRQCDSSIEACFQPEGVCKVYDAACDPAKPACLEGFFCSAQSGSCMKKMENASACSADDQCWTEACRNGFCCDEAV
jgi:hypothetical protein